MERSLFDRRIYDIIESEDGLNYIPGVTLVSGLSRVGIHTWLDLDRLTKFGNKWELAPVTRKLL